MTTPRASRRDALRYLGLVVGAAESWAAVPVHAQTRGQLSVGTATVGTVTWPRLVLTVPATLQGNAHVLLQAAIQVDAHQSPWAVTGVQWAVSDAKIGTVSRAGVLSSAAVLADQALVVTARAVWNGELLVASSSVHVLAAPSMLKGLEVLGSRSLQTGAQLRLRVLGSYADGSYRVVRPTSWSLHSDNSEAISLIFAGGLSVDFSRGTLKLNVISREYPLDITAVYTEGGITLSGRLDLVVTNKSADLEALRIATTSAELSGENPLLLQALGQFADRSLKLVAAQWQVDHPAATVSQDGVLTVMPNVTLTQDQPVLVSASFTQAGIAASAELLVMVRARSASAPLLNLELEAQGPRSGYSVSTWLRLPSRQSARGWLSARSADPVRYNVYVVAVVPGQDLNSSFFMLNRSGEWQTLAFPMDEYLASVVESQDYLLDILENVDTRWLAGTALYIGYGTSDVDMLAQQRYRLLLTL